MIAHWDEVDSVRRERGHLRAAWANLGVAAGTVTVGLSRIKVDPGGWSTPAHIHGAEEEIFYVLDGAGVSWQDGETYEIGPRDCIVYPPDEQAHTLHTETGLDVLAFGQRVYDEAALLPRAGVQWLGHRWVTTGTDDDHPWKREAEAGPPELSDGPSPRPSTIVNLADVESFDRHQETVRSTWTLLARAAGAELTGLNHVSVQPGKLAVPPHCHSAEEELFVVLDGDGHLELTPTTYLEHEHGMTQEAHPIRAGHVVSRPAGSGIAHGFRAGPDGMTLLAYGTREPNDIAYYPRSNKVYLRGVKLMGRLEPLTYWDGEA